MDWLSVQAHLDLKSFCTCSFLDLHLEAVIAISCHRGLSSAFNFSDSPCWSHPFILIQSILTLIPCITYITGNTMALNNHTHLHFSRCLTFATVWGSLETEAVSHMQGYTWEPGTNCTINVQDICGIKGRKICGFLCLY